MSSTLISIQIIPKTKNGEHVYDYVDAAIAVIDQAGVKYRVSPLETTMEGELPELLAIIQKMNEKMAALGAPNIISQIKILHQPAGITMDTLTEKYD